METDEAGVARVGQPCLWSQGSYSPGLSALSRPPDDPAASQSERNSGRECICVKLIAKDRLGEYEHALCLLHFCTTLEPKARNRNSLLEFHKNF